MTTLNLWPSSGPEQIVLAIEGALIAHRLHWAQTVALATCACGWQSEAPAMELRRERLHRHHLAEVIASLDVIE